jgi:general secretion pathway protein D
MTSIKLLLFVILAGTIAVPAVVAESAESDYKTGEKAEHKNNYDAAFQAFKKAHDVKPNDPKYTAAFLRMRFYAAAEHIRKGQALRDSGNIQDSLAEFRIAAEMDPTNFEALGEMRRTADAIQRQALEKDNAKKNVGQVDAIEREAHSAAGPVTLDIKWDTPISLHLSSTTVDVVYKTIAKITALNILIDPDYKPHHINIELQDLNFPNTMKKLQ